MMEAGQLDCVVIVQENFDCAYWVVQSVRQSLQAQVLTVQVATDTIQPHRLENQL